jgi:hypothetical protein
MPEPRVVNQTRLTSVPDSAPIRTAVTMARAMAGDADQNEADIADQERLADGRRRGRALRRVLAGKRAARDGRPAGRGNLDV